MAEIRPFRALRYNPELVDLADVIAPPYDIISANQQRALYDRNPHNIVRVEYGERHPFDTDSINRYSRAAADLASWRSDWLLIRDDQPAIYRYRLAFDYDGVTYTREHLFGVVRLEPWERGIVKPHEHTLAAPKSDRLELLRATRTQVSPVYGIFRPRSDAPALRDVRGDVLYEFESDDQRHHLSAIRDPEYISGFVAHLAASDVYIADGHHRYETALTYRGERLVEATTWTNSEAENFVLMALTPFDDPGLLVLPTHRMVHVAPMAGAATRVADGFDTQDVTGVESLPREYSGPASFIEYGLTAGQARHLTLRDRAGAESTMPPGQPEAWRNLDVNVLQYGLLRPVFGIDDAALSAGDALSYTQDAAEARRAVDENRATAAYLLRATPIEQLMAVADTGARMPQKSTYFHPKMPTGLLLNSLY